MFTRGLKLVITGFCLIGGAVSWGAPSTALELAKRATALVKISADGKVKGYGSAFCIDESGLFVTNAHVADGQVEMDLVLEPGETTQRVVTGKVLRSDKDQDLAILQMKQGAPFAALPLGKVDTLEDTNAITALGFPFGGALSLDENGYPSISVNTGRITSLRKKAGELELIQVDAALNPGNSGGPVIDEQGKVIGIVQSGIIGSGLSFVIPIRRLEKLIKEPLLSVIPTTLDYEKRADPQQIVVKVVSLERPTPSYNVELTLKAGAGSRVVSGITADGACRFNVPLAPPASADPAQWIVSATFKDGQIIGRAANHTFQVGGQKITLSAVRTIEFAPDGSAQVAVGDKTMTGKVSDLDGLAVIVGGAALKPNWSGAQSISIASANEPVRSVDYGVVIKLKGLSVAKLDGTFALDGKVPVGTPATIGTSPVASAIPMPGDLWKLIASGVAGQHTTLVEGRGGAFSMREPYTDGPEAGVLIGFNYSLGTFVNHSMINAMQPIFITAGGEKLGQMHGKVDQPVQAVRAKTGYVVTGLHVRAGGNFDGFSLTFTRLQGTKLIAGDTYESDVIGFDEHRRTSDEVTSGLVVGISGKQAEKIGSVSLVVLPLDGGGAGPPPVHNAPGVAPAPPFNPNPGPVAGSNSGAGGELPGYVSPPIPANGEAYTSFAQMFETLPTELQPSGHVWVVGRRVSPDLTHRLHGKPAVISGEFAETEMQGNICELHLDGGEINYRGFRLVGQIIARFPADQADRFKTLRIHDRLTVAGTMDQMVVRGGDINKAFLWISEPQLK